MVYLRVMKTLSLLLNSILILHIVASAETRQATGVKVGEVSDTSAIVWVRLTENSERNSDGVVVKGRPESKGPDPLPEGTQVQDLEGSCPGAPGSVRVRYMSHPRRTYPERFSKNADLDFPFETQWVEVSASNDFTHPFHLKDLNPNDLYLYQVETKGKDESDAHGFIRGNFRTAPKTNESTAVTFTVITGQMYNDTDRPDGFHIYESMGKLNPQFIVPTGDTVYYDSEKPRAVTVELARYHWHRMYSYRTLIDFHLKVPGYWIKDDHDTLSNDCWPTMNPEFMLPLTFEDGQRLFREQVPMGEKTFRTYRWGKHVQIWLPEGRDFRSANDAPDGPEKTIWGEEQKRWLFKSIQESDADWKILASATPIVGPDRGGKADNHANDAFATEGNEVRNWIAENCPDNLFVVCGDRHWQYESIDPKTKVHEFSCGPASDAHAGGIPKDSSSEYEWYRVEGGFLSVAVAPMDKGSEIAFRHHDVYGNVVHEFTKSNESIASTQSTK